MIVSIAGVTAGPLSLGDLSTKLERTTDRTAFNVEAQVGKRMDVCTFTLMDTIPGVLAIPDRAEVIVYDIPQPSANSANVVDPPNAISAYNTFKNGVGLEVTSTNPLLWTPRLFAGYCATPHYTVVGPQRYVEITAQDYTFRLRSTVVNQAFVSGSTDQAIILALGSRYRSDFDYSGVNVVTASFPAISFPVHTFEQFLERIIKVSRAIYRVDYYKRMNYGLAGALLSPINFADQISYAATVLADLPSAYWRLEDTTAVAVDSAGTSNGTISGGVVEGVPAPTPGAKAMNFNGVSGTIDTGFTCPAGTAFSIEAWVQMGAFNYGFPRVADTGVYQAANGWVFNVGSSGAAPYNSIGLLLNQGVGNTIGATAAFSGPTGWHHFVGTYDGTNIRVYVDGALVAGPVAGPVGWAQSSNHIFIGSTQGTAEFLPGGIHGVAYYPRALSADQAAKHWAIAQGAYSSVILADSPKGYWRLDDLASPALDAAGANNGVLSGGVTTGTPGSTNDGDAAMTFNGSTGLVTVPAAAWDPSANNPFSIECWVRPAIVDASFRRIAGREPVGNHGVMLAWHNSLHYYVGRGDAAAGIDTPSGGTPTQGVWAHLCATYDGTTLKMYVDGALGGSGSLASSRLADVGAANLLIGGTTGGGTNGQADIDEFAVYSYALSQAQILDHIRARSLTSPSVGISYPVEGSDYTPDGSGLVNKVWVIGSTFLSAPQAYTIPPTLVNGTNYQFPLPGDPEPIGMTVTVGGVDQGHIGIAPGDGDVATPSSLKYNAVIQHTPATIAFKTAPGSGVTIVVTGRFRYPLVQSVSDPALIAATNGVIFEGVLRDKRITDFTLARSVGQAYLTNQGQTLKGGNFLTKYRGHPTTKQLLQPGQVFSFKNDALFLGLLKDANGKPTTTGVMVITKLETTLTDDVNQPYDVTVNFADRSMSGGY